MDDNYILKRERRTERRKKQSGSAVSSLWRAGMWAGTALVIVAGVYFLATAISGPRPDSRTGVPAAVAADDWILGNKNASTTLIEYSDFQCPACAAQYPALKKAVGEIGQNFRFVYRYFPLKVVHKNAELAAFAAESAGRQDKFWEMHDKLFDAQADWANADGARNLFIEYARQLNLDAKRFEDDLNSGAVIDRVRHDENEGENIGINATPTFFLNGKQLERNPRGYDELKQILTATSSFSP